MADPDYGVRPPGYRLPDDLRLGGVRLQVADLGRSLTFYERVLGLRAEVADATAHLFAGTDVDWLIELREHPGASSVPRRGRLGLFHFAILLTDRAALGRLVRHLAEEQVPAGASDHLVSEALYLSDPDGLGIEVYADRPRSAWTTRGRELAMATMPLDLDDLVVAAGNERWTGMPAGTRIGHLHLHVGELDSASVFYHEAAGFDKVVWSYPGALFLSAGGYHHHLGVNTWAGPSAVPPKDDEARLLDWSIVLPSPADVRAWSAAVETRGVRVERSASHSVARDPWGTSVRVGSSTSS